MNSKKHLEDSLKSIEALAVSLQKTKKSLTADLDDMLKDQPEETQKEFSEMKEKLKKFEKTSDINSVLKMAGEMSKKAAKFKTRK